MNRGGAEALEEGIGDRKNEGQSEGSNRAWASTQEARRAVCDESGLKGEGKDEHEKQNQQASLERRV